MRTRILCRESDRISCVDYCAGSAHWVPLAHWPSHSAWDATFHNRYIPRWVANTWNGTHWVFNLWSNEVLAPGPALSCGPTTLSAIIKWGSYNNVVETLTSLGSPDKRSFLTPNNVVGKQIDRDTIAQRRDQVPEPGYCASVNKN